jgi:putative transcriptional regulator
MAKRKLFDEMMEGVEAMRAHAEGKITLRSFHYEPAPLPALDSAFIRETREKLQSS